MREFHHGNVHLYHGDCREIMPSLEYDAIVTDPPYGIKHRSGGQRFCGARPCAGDGSVNLLEWVCDTDKCVVCFYSPYVPPRVKWRSILVWDKGPALGIGGHRETCWKRSFELIGVKNNKDLVGTRDEAVIKNMWPDVKKASGHFCEKPVSLMCYLCNKIPERVIIDPFMGSGTTGVACVQLGKPFIGIEIDEEYFNVAVARLKDALSGGPLFYGSEFGGLYAKTPQDKAEKD